VRWAFLTSLLQLVIINIYIMFIFNRSYTRLFNCCDKYNFLAPVTWIFSIQIQGLVQLLIALYFLFEMSQYINIETSGAT
jgi:hypothetical protein